MKRRKGTETATKRAAAPRTRRRRHSQQPRDTLTQSWEAWSSWDADDRLQWWTGGRQARWVPMNREDEPEGWKWKSDHRNQGVADACPTSVHSVRGRSEPPPSRRSRGRTFEGDVYKECWEKSRGSTAVWRKKSEAPIRPIASTCPASIEVGKDWSGHIGSPQVSAPAPCVSQVEMPVSYYPVPRRRAASREKHSDRKTDAECIPGTKTWPWPSWQ